MLKQKATIARQWILRLICGIAMGLLVILFRGDFPLRAGRGQSQEGPQVEITEVDPDAVRLATFQSHNQKVVANAYGVFMTHIHKQECCDSNGNCCDAKDPLCFDPTPSVGRCRDAGRDFISTWRLSRSVNGGVTFTTIYEGAHGTGPPALETDSRGNIYLAHANYFLGGQSAYVNTWLSTFLVKGDKVHFVYRVGPPVNKQHYVRYDLATAHIDRNIIPFKGDGVPILNLDGVCSTRRSIKEIFCVSKTNNRNPDSRIVVLKSEDNGLTWRKHAVGPIAFTYALGGSPQVTDDGYIIGSYTESSNFKDPTAKKIVKFFKVASLAEPSRKDVVFTAGDLELTGGHLSIE